MRLKFDNDNDDNAHVMTMLTICTRRFECARMMRKKRKKRRGTDRTDINRINQNKRKKETKHTPRTPHAQREQHIYTHSQSVEPTNGTNV